MATVLETPTRQDEQRIVLDAIPWKTYLRFLREFDGRHIRLTYDRGTLEIMTVSFEHETHNSVLRRLIETLTEELNIAIRSGGQTTFKRARLKRGFEPDNCYWIAHEADIREKTKIDLRVDPPPDLMIEIEVSRSALDRMGIAAALRVPEFWRCDGESIQCHVLGADGKYAVSERSPTFPFLRLEVLIEFMQRRKELDETTLIREFRAWVRAQIARGWKPAGQVDTQK